MNRCSSTDEVTYRTFQPSDILPLSEILKKAWLQNDPHLPGDADCLATSYLCAILSSADWTCVAVYEDKPVGIICAHNHHRHTFHINYALKAAGCALSTCIHANSADDVSDYCKSEYMDACMLKETHMQFDACISLLAVNSNIKGHGIGGSLYRHFIEYMESAKLHSFYLFTDSYCDYSFYEHQGLKCIKKHGFLWRTGEHSETSEFYLYANQRA